MIEVSWQHGMPLSSTGLEKLRNADGDRQMPILTTFVPSHASGVPLKVSIHRWAAPSFTDDALQRSKQVGSTLYHEARITIDGTLVASAILECPYPYIIDTRKSIRRFRRRHPINKLRNN